MWDRITDDRVVVFFTIYDHPRDHPNSFVVRRWVSSGGRGYAGEMRLAFTLEEARGLLPPGVCCLGRRAEDEPQIVETWV